MDHTYRTFNNDPTAPQGPIQFRLKFLLKQKNKVVGSGQRSSRFAAAAKAMLNAEC